MGTGTATLQRSNPTSGSLYNYNSWRSYHKSYLRSSQKQVPAWGWRGASEAPLLAEELLAVTGGWGGKVTFCESVTTGQFFMSQWMAHVQAHMSSLGGTGFKRFYIFKKRGYEVGKEVG